MLKKPVQAEVGKLHLQGLLLPTVCWAENNFTFLNGLGPWLMWLSGLSAGLGTKRSLVQFPVRAHAWITGQVPC